ncbi:MAG: ArsA-related P-loop ATPase, partial [Actinomycetota bacterium]
MGRQSRTRSDYCFGKTCVCGVWCTGRRTQARLWELKLPQLLDHRLLFVTGKGGVGKTTFASALASFAASTGKKTLIVEMDDKGALARSLATIELQFAAREVAPNLFAMSMNTEDSLREYIRLFV